jgi:hypothetical protein
MDYSYVEGGNMWCDNKNSFLIEFWKGTYSHSIISGEVPRWERGQTMCLKPLSRVRSLFATVCFKTVHLYDPCRVGPSTPDLRCSTLATQASFVYLVRFYSSFPVCTCFLFFCFSAVHLNWLWFFHQWRPSKRQIVLFCKRNVKNKEDCNTRH